MKAKTVLDAVNEFKGVWPYTFSSYAIHWCGNKKSMMAFASMLNGHEPNSNWYTVCAHEEFNQCVQECTDNFGAVPDDKPTIQGCSVTNESLTIRVNTKPVYKGKLYTVSDVRSCKDSILSNNGLWINPVEDSIADDKPVYTQDMKDNGELPSVGMMCLFSFESGKFERVVIDFISETLAVVTDQYSAQVSFSIKDAQFKPLTPPITLEDGKAYQFDVRDKGGIVNGIYHEYDKKLHVGPNHYFDLLSAINIKPLTVEVTS